MDIDGTNVQQITNTSANSYVDSPSISQNKGLIVYRKNLWTGTRYQHSIVTMNYQGQNNNVIYSAPLGTSVTEPSISSDGEKIYFTHTFSGNYEIFSINFDGSDLNNLTDTSNFYEENPKISPDGTKVLYTSSKEGKQSIYVMNSDGSNDSRITFHSSIDFYPSWSTSNDMIIWNSTRDENIKGELYIMNSNGTSKTRITNNNSTESNASFD